MVKMIKGSYGHKQGKAIVPVYAGETVELTEEQEARLVNLGVAEYVEASAKQQNVNNEGAAEGDNLGELPAYNESMKLAELKAIAAKYGVDASEAKSKKEVIALIEAAQEQPELGGDDTVVDA